MGIQGSTQASRAKGDIASATDDELLVYMSMAKDCPTEARAAWGEFYERYRGYVATRCWHAYCRQGDEDLLESLVVETFSIAFQRAGTFVSGGITDPTRLHRRIKAWLGWFMKRAYASIHEVGNMEVTVDWDLDTNAAAVPDEHAGVSANRERLLGAMSQLSERERHVLRVTYQYYDTENPLRHMPDNVLEALAEELGTSTENIRQIRHRALQKLKSALKPVRTP